MADSGKRRDVIHKSLIKDGACSISALARNLGVSTMTIRRDLDVLSRKGAVRVYHGVAVPGREEAASPQEYELNHAESLHVQQKLRIAKAAAAIVEPGDILIIDGGSTAALTTRELPRGIPLTVICLSLNAFLGVTGNPNTEVILAGGSYHEETRIFEGPESVALLRRYRATKAFISANGFREDLGVTCLNHYLLSIKQAALRSSIQKVLIADSSKFGKVSSCYFADLSDFDAIITDSDIPESALQSMREHGISIEAV
jgi:DeoR family transcriptional regulator, deoxyribose operon repressor